MSRWLFDKCPFGKFPPLFLRRKAAKRLRASTWKPRPSLEETRLRRTHWQIEERLEALHAGTSTIRDAALAMGGMNWGLFFQAQSDTPAKLVAFLYAVLHLEIGGYELLKRTAQRLGDDNTRRLCETIVAEKRAMADRLTGAFDSAAEATLEAVRD